MVFELLVINWSHEVAILHCVQYMIYGESSCWPRRYAVATMPLYYIFLVTKLGAGWIWEATPFMIIYVKTRRECACDAGCICIIGKDGWSFCKYQLLNGLGLKQISKPGGSYIKIVMRRRPIIINHITPRQSKRGTEEHQSLPLSTSLQTTPWQTTTILSRYI